MDSIYELIPFAYIKYDVDTLKVLYINKKFFEIFTYNDDFKFDYITDIDFIDNESINYFEIKEDKEIKVENLKNMEYPIVLKKQGDFGEIYIDYLTEKKTSNVDIDKIQKERQELINISTELKAKCEIIEILRKKEKEHIMYLRSIMENVSEGIIVIDKYGSLSLCNNAVFKITNMTNEELFKMINTKNKYNIYNYETGKEFYDVYNKYFKKSSSIENLILELEQNNNKKYIQLNSRPIVDRQKKLLYTVVTLKDISELKIHEEKLEKQKDFITDIVNTLEIPIAVVSYPSYQVTLVNRTSEEFMENVTNNKYKYEDMLERRIDEFLDSDLCSKVQNIIKMVVEHKKEYSINSYSVTGKNGIKKYFRVKFKAYDYKNNDQIFSNVFIHVVDITNEINHSIELESITRLKDEFFAITSHELRTPLTIIYSSIQLAQSIYANEITENIGKIFLKINQNCSRLLKLINNILDISKAEAGFLTVNNSCFDIVYLTEYIVTSVNAYAKNRGVNLIFDTNREEMLVTLDKDKYEKIIMNLLSNAIKFTEENKTIEVKVNVDDKNIAISVKDEGIGIPPNKIKKIFDRFSQVNSSLSRNAEGTGLGLALVKKLVNIMKGKINVKSKMNEGTEFIITFKKDICKINSEISNDLYTEKINQSIYIEFSDVN